MPVTSRSILAAPSREGSRTRTLEWPFAISSVIVFEAALPTSSSGTSRRDAAPSPRAARSTSTSIATAMFTSSAVEAWFLVMPNSERLIDVAT